MGNTYTKEQNTIEHWNKLIGKRIYKSNTFGNISFKIIGCYQSRYSTYTYPYGVNNSKTLKQDILPDELRYKANVFIDSKKTGEFVSIDIPMFVVLELIESGVASDVYGVKYNVVNE
jgi:hypothetical protein